jgi:hypothetical protein
MVLVKNKADSPTTIYPPKTVTKSVKELTLTLHSISSNTDYTFPVDDTGALRDYYEIEVDFSAMPDGEYQYTIGCDSGLLVIGDYKEKRKEQNKQYDAETKYYQYQG